MVKIPEAAVGTVIAALIAGIISLLGLIISKEQKTSEFRQTWIDALRSDLSAYLTQINAIHDATKVTYSNLEDKVSALQPLYIPLNTSTFNILLRVNPKEKKSQILLDAMDGFSKLMLNEEELNTKNIRKCEAEFLVAAQSLLKFEWNRVKSGEPTFKIAKICALLVVAISLVSGFITAAKFWSQPPAYTLGSNPIIVKNPPETIIQSGGSKMKLPKTTGTK